MSEDIETKLLHYLVANLGGHSVTIVRGGENRMTGYSSGAGKGSIAIRDLLDFFMSLDLKASDIEPRRNDEAGYAEFANHDGPFVVREIDGRAAILIDVDTRRIMGYRAYDPEGAPAPTTTSKLVWSELTIIRLPWHKEPNGDFWRAEVIGYVYEVYDDEMADYKKRQCQYDFEARIRSVLAPIATTEGSDNVQ